MKNLWKFSPSTTRLSTQELAALKGGDWIKTDDAVVNPNGPSNPPPPGNG
ncbi:MAG: hypothetical protein AAFQ98_20005 [Bacteroidota bacterium]